MKRRIVIGEIWSAAHLSFGGMGILRLSVSQALDICGRGCVLMPLLLIYSQVVFSTMRRWYLVAIFNNYHVKEAVSGNFSIRRVCRRDR